jgi:hypothetical protein
MIFSNETVATLLAAALLLALIAVLWWDAVAFGLVAGTVAMAFIALLAGYDGIALSIVIIMTLVTALLRLGSRRRKRR